VAIAATLLLSALFAAPANAGSTRVSVTDFRWSQMPQIDLGESVTWDWIGPDTQHSITGQAPNASQWDSDPGTVNAHPLGDSFRVTFNEPGVYEFICRLHVSVRGTVTVSNVPGDPDSDPGPQAPLNLDLEPPYLPSVYLSQTVLGFKGSGTAVNFAIDERGTGSADFYRLVKKNRGKNRKPKTVREFAGYQNWNNHVGNNKVRFAHRSSLFRAQPGKYVALVTATDESANTTPSVKLNFEIKAKPKKKKPRR